jgi:type VI secretion system secreted protein Hcp
MLHRAIIAAVSFSVLSIVTPSPASAKTAVGTFMIPEVAGLAAATPVYDIELGLTATASNVTGAGAGAGKATFDPVAITRGIDAGSPQLLLGLASGRAYPTAVVTLSNGGVQVVYTLEGVVITSLRQSGTEDATERVALSYRRITISTGGATATWDVAANAQQ